MPNTVCISRKCIKLYFVLFQLLTGSCLFAQHGYSLTAKLKQGEEPVSGATVLILTKDSVILRSAVSNTEGSFRFASLDSGRYILSVTHTGLQPYFAPIRLEGTAFDRDLGPIALERSAGSMQGVTVQAQKPVIEYKNDRVVFNVSAKMQKSSRSSFDLLNKAPGVTVGRDNSLQIDGQSNILVMVNGRQRFSSPAEAVQFLRNLPAEQVLSIEVVQQPSARYDQSAAGGILNIVLKKDETQGLKGSWNGYFNSGAYTRAGSGINLNYRVKKLNIYTLYNYNHDIQYERSASRESIGGYVLDQDYTTVRRPEYNNLRMGADLSLSKNHVVGLLANITSNNQDISRNTGTFYHPALNSTDSLITVDEARRSRYDRLFVNFNYSGNFNDSNAHTLTFDASYLKDDLRNESDFLHHYYNSALTKLRPDFLLYDRIPSLVDLWVLRLEYSQKLKKGVNLEAGLKSTFSSTDNDVRYDTVVNSVFIPDATRTNHYVYRENVYAAYASLSKFTPKTGWVAGLRYEGADVEGRTIGQPTLNRRFNGLLPSLAFRYTINKNQRLTLNLRKIVGRPDFVKLNPFVQYVNQNLFYQGNPDLKQFNIYISSIKYTYKKYSVTLRYDYTANYIPQELLVREGSSLVTKATYANAADLHGLQLTVYVPFERFKWWSSYNNINVFHGTVRSRDGNYTGLDFTNTSGNISSSNIFTLPLKLFAELNLNVGTRSRNNQTTYKGSYGLDIRLTRSFLDNLLKVSAVLDDITYQSRLRGFSEYNGVVNNFSTRSDTRRIGVAASLQFGRKKVAERRQRSVGTEDEESRIKKF